MIHSVCKYTVSRIAKYSANIAQYCFNYIDHFSSTQAIAFFFRSISLAIVPVESQDVLTKRPVHDKYILLMFAINGYCLRDVVVLFSNATVLGQPKFFKV